jgi:tRNA(Ile)-lysidine synthetase-like protein
MDIKLEPGAYILAISGGVDSVVLLDLISRLTDLKLVVAHYDHGIRPDSDQDQLFVASLADHYGLPFYSDEGKLGPKASEALARAKRYEFLRQVRRQTGADAIVTAHHQDDLIETAILNLLRGTGRRGLSSLRSTDDIRRPLLATTKNDLIAYARQHQLVWREDPTNQDDAYLRNYVRHQIITKLSLQDRQQLLKNLDRAAKSNPEIDRMLGLLLADHSRAGKLDRTWFINLPHDLARELLLAWLRQLGVLNIDRRQIERITILIKTLQHGKLIDVNAGYQLKVEAQTLALMLRER